MSLKFQLVYPLPEPKKFYESLFSKDGKMFERNEIGTRPFYPSSEPHAKICSPKCSSKSLIFVRDGGEYVCGNNTCENCGTVVEEKVFEIPREMTRVDKEALEMDIMDIEEKQTGNL